MYAKTETLYIWVYRHVWLWLFTSKSASVFDDISEFYRLDALFLQLDENDNNMQS